MKRMLLAMSLVLIVGGCSTTGHFKIPENSELYIYQRPRPVDVRPDGTATMMPFFWTGMGMPPSGGIPYRLERGGKVLKEGKLRANFRIVSLFWPPFAIIYWPTGLNPHITYDLVNDKQQ